MKNKFTFLFITILLSACVKENEPKEELELQPPTINITSPENDTTFNFGAEIVFKGNLNDVADPESELEVLISSNIQDNLTTDIIKNNNSFSWATSDLIEGTHIITFTVIDSDQLQNSDIITVNILPLEDPVFSQLGDKIPLDAIHIESSFDGNKIAILEEVNGTINVKTYIFENSVWKTNLVNDISNTDMGTQNSSLSMSKNGNFLAIGSSNRNFNSPDPALMSLGIVRIYENINNQWMQVGEDLMTGNLLDGFGNSSRGNGIDLSSDGSIIAIGALDYSQNNEFGDDNGLVKVYKNNQGVWEQIGNDLIGDIDTHTGQAVSLSDDGLILAVGSGKYQNFTGQIKVYKFENNDWSQIGNAINGDAEDDLLGSTLSISANGNILAVSAPNPGNFTMGYAKVFENTNDNWVQIGETIRSDGNSDYLRFGLRLSFSSDGSTLALSAIGKTRVYQVAENAINEFDIDIESTTSPMSLSSDGSRLIVKNMSEVFVYDIGEFTLSN